MGTSLCRYVGDPEAIAHAMQQVWPLLEKGFTRHKGSLRAIERYARCPRYALRSSGRPPVSPVYDSLRVFQAQLMSSVLVCLMLCPVLSHSLAQTGFLVRQIKQDGHKLYCVPTTRWLHN